MVSMACHVQGLSLQNNHLSGYIPAQIGSESDLRYFHVGSNILRWLSAWDPVECDLEHGEDALIVLDFESVQRWCSSRRKLYAFYQPCVNTFHDQCCSLKMGCVPYRISTFM